MPAIRPSKIHPFTGRDLPWLLDARADSRADHPFLIFAPHAADPETWSYRAFRDAVVRFAGGLVSRGVRQHDFVVIHMENCIEFLIAWHALSRIGAVAVTTNTRSSEDELRYFLDHCGAACAITQPKFQSLLRRAGEKVEHLVVTLRDAGDHPETPREAEAISFEAVLAGDPALAPLRPADPLAFNSVQYTSGTTSRPKGVIWTHANALWGAKVSAEGLQLSETDVGHTCLPLYHTNALSYSHLATLWRGSTLVFQQKFSASRYWPCVTRHGCTWGVQIPFMLKALRDQPMPAHALKRWGLGSINPPAHIKAFGVPILGWFGMTETVSLPILSTLGLPGRVGSMGVLTPGYDIAVRREDGSHVDFGESGMLWIRGVAGVSMFEGYLNNPEATEEAYDPEGWFRTGDRVTPHADGYIVFDGRDRDMLRVGAENVAESEIERVLLASGLVTEAAVVGKPHPMLDEVPVAFVTISRTQNDPSEALLQVCREKLAAFKVPAEIHVVEDFPRVTLGKIDKKTLRASLRSRLADSDPVEIRLKPAPV
ncbi:MAG: AMP-binding protein [Hyphomonadaceae bacterium]